MIDDITSIRRPSTLRDRPEGAARPVRRDPLGKQALFTPPIAAVVADEAARDLHDDDTIDDPLADTIPFPAPAAPSRLGSVTIECSLCAQATRIGYAEFIVANLPLGLWMQIGRAHV